jgi:excisionase family DNA binding protein
MQENVKNGNTVTPMLFPFEPDKFWSQIRVIIREEVQQLEKRQSPASSLLETPGLTQKPLLKIGEVCQLFQVTKPTIYDWIKHGKLKPFKVRSRVYFLWQDVQELLPRQSA